MPIHRTEVIIAEMLVLVLVLVERERGRESWRWSRLIFIYPLIVVFLKNWLLHPIQWYKQSSSRLILSWKFRIALPCYVCDIYRVNTRPMWQFQSNTMQTYSTAVSWTRSMFTSLRITYSLSTFDIYIYANQRKNADPLTVNIYVYECKLYAYHIQHLHSRYAVYWEL